MKRQSALLLTVALVAALATGATVLEPGMPGDALVPESDGVGPLTLGREYNDAVSRVRRVSPDTAFAGLGCNGLDEVRFHGRLAGLPVSVMGMARSGRLAEVEISLDSPVQTSDEQACIALRDDFAAPFLERFGATGDSWQQHKPVSREHLLRAGPAIVAARWFPSGRSCYVSASYEAAGNYVAKAQ